jgi:hypothetical protein
MKVWITKYALTQGIILRDDAERCVDNKDMVLCKNPGSMSECYLRQEWHETEKAALARAEEMRKAKIAGMRKGIRRLKGLKIGVFTPKELGPKPKELRWLPQLPTAT